MAVKHPWEPVARSSGKLAASRDQRLKAFAPALKTFLEQTLHSPIPDDWRDRLEDFVEETPSGGLRIAERSIADIEKLIERRIAKRAAIPATAGGGCREKPGNRRAGRSRNAARIESCFGPGPAVAAYCRRRLRQRGLRMRPALTRMSTRLPHSG